MLQKDDMNIYLTYKRIDNDLFTLYSNILLQNDRYFKQKLLPLQGKQEVNIRNNIFQDKK